jgi:hypothetical protein
MAGKRIFSEQEAAKIMQQAVRMQEASAKGEQYTPGITAEELKKIAQEAGIDVAFLERAIAGVDTEEKSTLGPFNLTEEFERVVEGEMNPEDYDKILKLIKPGQTRGVSQVGRTLTGIGTVGPHMMHLNVESRKGRTKVKVKYSPVFAYLIGLHGPVIGSIIAMAATAEKGNVLLGLGIAAGLLAVGSAAFNYLVKAGRAAARKLTGQIVEVVEEESGLRGNLAHASAGAASEQEQARVEEKA